MTEKFSTNSKIVVFYVVLSVIVFVPGWLNFYNMITNSASYSFGVKSFLALVLPLFCIFSYQNGLLTVHDNDGLKFKKNYYKFEGYDFLFSQQKLQLKDRPLTSIWQENYPILVIENKKSKGKEIIQLSIFSKQLEKLKNLIQLNSISMK
jgi:hypothetical protein